MKKLLIITFLLGVCAGVEAQNMNFSQYMNNPLYLNPANTGHFYGDYRVNVDYRRQWENIGAPFQTFSVSGDMPILRNRNSSNDLLAVGVNLIGDQSGNTMYNQLGAAGTFAYTLAMDGSKSHLFSVGFQAGIYQRSFSADGLYWGNQWGQTGFDPSMSSGEGTFDESKLTFDLGGGIKYFYNSPDGSLKAHIGAAAFHLNQANTSFYFEESDQQNIKVMLNGGLDYFDDKYNMVYSPSFMYQRMGFEYMAVYGIDVRFLLKEPSRYTGYVRSTNFAIGLYNRWNDAIIPMVKLATQGFELGLSYDISIGNITRVNNGYGGPEITLVYRGGNAYGGRSSRKLNSAFK